MLAGVQAAGGDRAQRMALFEVCELVAQHRGELIRRQISGTAGEHSQPAGPAEVVVAVGDPQRQVVALEPAVPAALGAQGTFVAMNNIVSQSVPHLHCHVVPRTKGDGLRGFFWPRTKYDSDDQMAEVATTIRDQLRGSSASTP